MPLENAGSLFRSIASWCVAVVIATCTGVASELAQGSWQQGGRSQGTRAGSQIPAIRAIETGQTIVLDGLLDEEAWRNAETVSRFLQRDPQEGSPATERTEVRILFDSHRLYIGVICYDTRPVGIRATELRRDNSLGDDDIFEVVLDSLHDHRSGYLFRVNPLGTQYDATITGEGQTVNANWDEKWDARTRITETGWSVEMAIPFKALRFVSGETPVWGVNFHRTIKRKNEDVYWTAHNRNYRFEEVSRAGHLEGLSEIQGFTFRFKPYVTTGLNKALVRDAYETNHLTDVGIEDAKYMITPQMALDLTVNPDFAQADVDQVQTNFSRFNLFFPEKREFFQEGSGIFNFSTGGGDWGGGTDLLLFHSRRIGLSPTREEIPIRAGLKLTGKQGPLDIGFLNMQTARFGQIAGQNFTVLRAKANILSRSYVGAMYTRNTAGASGFLNQAGGVDFSFTFLENLTLTGLLVKNDAPSTDQEQWAGQAKIGWDSDRFGFSAEHVSIQKNFLPEMGFVSRAEPNWEGVKRNVLQGEYSPRPAVEWVRQMEFSASLDYITNQQDVLDTREAEVGWSVDFQSGDAVDFEVGRNFERLVRPLRIRRGGTVAGTVAPGDYRINEYSLMYRAFRGRPVSGNLRFETGGFYNGNQTSLDISPQFKVSPNLSIQPGYEWNKISLPRMSALTLHEMNTYINYSFNQKWLTRTAVQFSSQDKQYAMNFRLNYIFRPGDDLFIIYNESRTYGSGGQLQNRALIVKTTFSLDR